MFTDRAVRAAELCGLVDFMARKRHVQIPIKSSTLMMHSDIAANIVRKNDVRRHARSATESLRGMNVLPPDEKLQRLGT